MSDIARYIESEGNGKYKVYSTIVDDYVFRNVTPEEIINIYVEEAKERIREDVTRDIERLNR
ncbi:MAG: hypothetical protein ACQEXX_19930 [Bacillota bacterium]